MTDPRDLLLARTQVAGRLPSVVGGLVDIEGRLRWTGSAGTWSAREGGWPGRPEDVQYRIGSITKTMTAVLLLQARDSGVLDLDAPLSAYLPRAVYADRSLRALLSHTAGVPAEPAGPWWERHGRGSREELLTAEAGRLPTAAEGTELRYSNLGFGLLGAVAEEVLGAPWWDLVRGRVLEPLGMTRTTWHPVAPHAQGWSVRHLDGQLVPEPHSDTGAMAPAGQLWSTLADLATYAGFLLVGHPGVLATATLAEVSPPRAASGYGLGIRREGALVGHTGTMPGFMATLFADRDRGAAYVGLANGTTGHPSVPLARTMLGEALAHEPVTTSRSTAGPWRPPPAPPAPAGALLGSWRWGERPLELRWDTGPTGLPELQLVELRGESVLGRFSRRGGRWLGADGTELEVLDEEGAPGGTSLDLSTYRLHRPPVGVG